MKLWLDDERNPLTYGDGWDCTAAYCIPTHALKVLQQYGRDGWVWVQTVEDAKRIMLSTHISVLSCDNDLGDNVPEGYTLLDWLEERAFLDPHFDIPDNIFFHSANEGRRPGAEAAIAKIEKFRGEIDNVKFKSLCSKCPAM